MLPYVKLFGDLSATIDLLSDAEAGRLLKSLMHYINDQEDELLGQEKLVFAMLKSQIDRDSASYAAFADKQRENGKKGGRPKKPTGFDKNPENPGLFGKTQKSQEKEKEKEEDKEKEGGEAPPTPRKARARFIPPTPEEVAAYCQERGNGVNPQRFVDVYAARGWKINGQKMEDWKAAVRTWEGREDYGYSGHPPDRGKTVSAQRYAQRSYTESELDAVSDDIIAEARELRGKEADA